MVDADPDFSAAFDALCRHGKLRLAADNALRVGRACGLTVDQTCRSLRLLANDSAMHQPDSLAARKFYDKGAPDQVDGKRFDVIDMVCCRHDYGYGNGTVMGFFWELLGRSLSDEEIADYAEAVEPDEEAREAIVEDLKQWRAMQGGE